MSGPPALTALQVARFSASMGWEQDESADALTRPPWELRRVEALQLCRDACEERRELDARDERERSEQAKRSEFDLDVMTDPPLSACVPTPETERSIRAAFQASLTMRERFGFEFDELLAFADGAFLLPLSAAWQVASAVMAELPHVETGS